MHRSDHHKIIIFAYKVTEIDAPWREWERLQREREGGGEFGFLDWRLGSAWKCSWPMIRTLARCFTIIDQKNSMKRLRKSPFNGKLLFECSTLFLSTRLASFPLHIQFLSLSRSSTFFRSLSILSFSERKKEYTLQRADKSKSIDAFFSTISWCVPKTILKM